MAIDIPVGIIEEYGREADTAARRFIQPRGSSVFPTSSQANPTLTLVALALRLGRHLSTRLACMPGHVNGSAS